MSNWNSVVPVGSGIGPYVAANGNTVVALSNPGDSSSRQLHVAVSRDGGVTYSAAVNIGGNTTTLGVTPPAAAVGADGSIFVAFGAYGDAGYHQVFLSRCTPQGVWSGPTIVTPFNANGAALAIDSTGKLWLSYAHIYTGGADAQVEVSSSTNGGVNWTPVVTISPRGFYCNETAVAVNSAGEVCVAYEYGLLNQYQMYSAHTMQGVWQTATLVEAAPAHSFWPRLASSGTKFGLVYQCNSSGGVRSILRELTTDGGWGNAVVVAESAFNPSIAYGSDGAAYICYTDTSGAMGVAGSKPLDEFAAASELPDSATLVLKVANSTDNFAAKTVLSANRSTGSQMASSSFGVVEICQHDAGGGNWQCETRSLTLAPPPPPPSEQLFQDEPPTSDFYPVAQWAGQNGYVHGYPCGGPNEPCVPPHNLPYLRKGEGLTVRRFLQILFNKK